MLYLLILHVLALVSIVDGQHTELACASDIKLQNVVKNPDDYLGTVSCSL